MAREPQADVQGLCGPYNHVTHKEGTSAFRKTVTLLVAKAPGSPGATAPAGTTAPGHSGEDRQGTVVVLQSQTSDLRPGPRWRGL